MSGAPWWMEKVSDAIALIEEGNIEEALDILKWLLPDDEWEEDWDS